MLAETKMVSSSCSMMKDMNDPFDYYGNEVKDGVPILIDQNGELIHCVDFPRLSDCLCNSFPSCLPKR